MKKLVALLLLFSSPVYALSDCTDKPTCEEIGYTHNEYACDQKIAMPCPFDSSKIYCPGPICETGYFLYSDGSCSLALKSDKTVIGIVFDKEWRLAVSVEPSVSLRWAEGDAATTLIPELGWDGYGYEIVCRSYCNGRENTKAIIDFAVANGYSYPAAEYCYNLSALGKGKGSWWLPSDPEWHKIKHGLEAINVSLAKLDKGELVKARSYWSSHQRPPEFAGNSSSAYCNPNGGGCSGWSKAASLHVICITRY